MPIAEGCVEGEGLAWVRIEFGGKPVTIAGLHLDWPYPYDQPTQIDALEPQLKALPRPIIVGGDFNAAPWSHAVARIAQETGTSVVGGLRMSWRVLPKWAASVPMLPLDQILLPAGAVVPGEEADLVAAGTTRAGDGRMAGFGVKPMRYAHNPVTSPNSRITMKSAERSGMTTVMAAARGMTMKCTGSIDIMRNRVDKLGVTEPEIRTAEQARRYAEELQLLLRAIGASDADMERGQMRVEANVSLRPRGTEAFGTRVEVKNMNS